MKIYIAQNGDTLINISEKFKVDLLQVKFSYSEKDHEIIRQMKDALNQAATAMGIPLISRNGQPPICLMPPGSDYNESGTCRMCDDPTTSAIQTATVKFTVFRDCM
ncbi:hypothetical protein [Metabacillus sp. Hm71]|uniref:hypothetical protein n=1 Tax=Metabacillus sp. Hm71 TaxID=3450743 RepID=UPI003F4337AC